jgi:glycosyltransferase involved in cell wall biosynthesis
MIAEIPELATCQGILTRPLKGLVVMDKIGFDEGGKNYSLHLSKPHLNNLGLSLDFVASSSIHRFLLSIFRHFDLTKIRYDFIIFNSIASLFYVNVHGIYTGIGHLLLYLFMKTRIPIFIYWHETEWVFDLMKKKYPRKAKAIDYIVSNGPMIHLAASRACGNYLKYHFPSSNPTSIYECSQIPKRYDLAGIPSSPPIVVNVASIQERKGTDLFVDTAIKVCDRHPRVKFIWMGDGADFGSWRNAIARSPHQNRIWFAGYVDNPYEILSQASIFFLTSRDDPFPLAILDAMNLARTIIAFSVGGVPEALDGHGILLESFDTDSAATTILEFLSKKPEDLISPALRERYKKLFTPEVFAARLSRIIRNHLSLS